MKWLAPLLLLLVLPVQADEGRRTKQDLEKDPQYHIKLAELYAGQKATLDKALQHWEQAWERAQKLDRKTQTRIIKAMTVLRAALPKGKKPRKVNKWKVLGLVFRKVTWYEGDDDERKARYNVPDDVLKAMYYGNALRLLPGLPRTGWPE